MAVSVQDHGATKRLPKLQIEAVTSVSPMKMTEPRQVRHVMVSDTTGSVKNPTTKVMVGGIGCYQIVLYYEDLNKKGCSLFLGGWIVESLGRAAIEYPLIAGRLKRKENNIDHIIEWEIVSNDSGIRLYEARFPMELSEFLVLSEKEHLEAELAFWKAIDEHRPEFSPLCYVQVTKFEGGGYSIGISCSLLLAEILVIENFLKKWAKIHNNMFLQNEEIERPLYHPTILLRQEPPLAEIISLTPSTKGAHTLLFKITGKEANFNKEQWRELAMLCVEEAEQKLQKNMGSDNFLLFVNESYEVINIEGCSKNGNNTNVHDELPLKNDIIGATWNDFEEYDVAFYEGNKPVLVSSWIGPVFDGNVIALPYHEGNVSAVIIVTISSK